ncbi:MAG: phosphoesterase [Desulfamplus sp.]|nr:phosphoesterase [Desulfamplus sp.]
MERVLCVNRADIPDFWLEDRTAMKIDEDTFFAPFLNSNFKYHWIDRAIAETDSSFKQIIPYIVIQADSQKLTAIYSRKGGESRLHGLWSIGIGGHINPLDDHLDSSNFKDILYSGMLRELNEELIFLPQILTIDELQKSKELSLKFIGVINEELTEVGKVHFGVVFKIVVKSSDIFTPAQELANFQWIRTDMLLKHSYNPLDFNLELWSQLAIELF